MKIRKITIKRFRSIKEQVVDDIGNSLVLIGKNNSGKSAILTAIRLLFGDYFPKDKDFYKDSDSFEIDACFVVSDDYISEFFLDKKLGFTKFPSSLNEFNSIKEGTTFEGTTFNDFKTERNSVVEEFYDDISTRERFGTIWIKAFKNRFSIVDGFLNIKVICNKNDLKINYEINGTVNKDIPNLFPDVAFIDDTRYFEEEETGKAKTITSSLFNYVLKTQSIPVANAITCDKCNRTDCEITCINEIRQKTPLELTVEDLQKLINYKTHNSAESITRSISERFQNNYQKNFTVNIKAVSNIDKSFSITTKIYDPNLDAEIDLSNVGAGVRSIYILSLLQSFQAMNSKYTIFIIEEPELYLHPELQKTMADTLAQISSNCQVVFTSHSPIMLRAFCNSDIRKVRLNEEEYFSIVENTTIDDVINEIGYSSQDILNTDFILFVEGPDDKTIFELVLNKYYDIDLERLLIIDTKSCNSIGFYATLRFLGKTTMSEDFAIIRDADTMSYDTIKEILCNQLNSNVDSDFASKAISKTHITKFSSIEGYLFSPELLVSHDIYVSEDEVYEMLKNRLTEKKDKCLRYFRTQNDKSQERIELFESEYDSRIANAKENLDWIKTNIQGHTYFGFTKSGRINFENYVEELPQIVFDEFIEFFNGIPYFLSKKRN